MVSLIGPPVPLNCFTSVTLQIKGLSLIAYGTYDERHIPKKLQRPWRRKRYRFRFMDETGPTTTSFYPDIAVPLELVPTFGILAGSKPKHLGGYLHPQKALCQGSIPGPSRFGKAAPSVAPFPWPSRYTISRFRIPPSSKTLLYFSDYNVNLRHLGQTYIADTIAPRDPWRVKFATATCS